MILPGAEPFFLPGGREGVLLIHGFTGLPAELLLMGQYLHAQGFSVLGVRLAGHGTTVEDMSHMTWEDWMDSVRDGYALLSGFCDTVDVIGHSMGGLFALLLSSEEKIGKVVTLAAPIQMNFAREVANKVMFMADGNVVESGTPEEIFDHPQRQRTQDFLRNML